MHPKALRNIVNDWLAKAVIIPAASLMAKPHKNSRWNLSFFLANGRNVKIGVDKWPRKRYYATIQGGHAIENRGKEKISDEEAERRDDDVYGDVHVQHVHVSSRSLRSETF